MVFSVQILGRLRAASAHHGLAALLLCTAALSGCGQKGPLFLPVPPKAPSALKTDTPPNRTTAPPAVTRPMLPASDAR
ncbi:MAG: LPS translocon maturation chaperone LptM [Polaromonas sp.]